MCGAACSEAQVAAPPRAWLGAGHNRCDPSTAPLKGSEASARAKVAPQAASPVGSRPLGLAFSAWGCWKIVLDRLTRTGTAGTRGRWDPGARCRAGTRCPAPTEAVRPTTERIWRLRPLAERGEPAPGRATRHAQRPKIAVRLAVRPGGARAPAASSLPCSHRGCPASRGLLRLVRLHACTRLGLRAQHVWPTALARRERPVCWLTGGCAER